MSENRIFDNAAPVADDVEYMRHGRSLVNQICIYLKTARIYEPENNNFKLQSVLTHDMIQENLKRFGDLTIQIQSDYLFYCGIRLRLDADHDSNTGYLMKLFQAVGISGIMIDIGFTSNDLRAMATVLNQAETKGIDNYERLQMLWQAAGIEFIELLPPVVEATGKVDETRQKRLFAKKAFFSAMSNLKSVVSTIGANRSVDLTRTSRIIHSLVDQVVSDDAYLLELTALQAHDEYTFLHSTNVCVYSICLGNSLKLGKTELANLGFAALFHDIGKTRLPLQVLNKPTEFDEAEWDLVRKHPTYGVLAIAKTMPFDDNSCRAMLVAFEHHFNLDGTGYPFVKFKRNLNLFSKIVAICDVFDALTSGRVYRKDAISPEHVLRKMRDQAGFKFDPFLLKVFINTVSLYPPGTLLLLDDGRLAMAVGRSRHDLFRPRVKVIGDMFQLYEIAEELDLSETDEMGSYQRAIVRAIEPQELPLNLSHYVLQSFQ